MTKMHLSSLQDYLIDNLCPFVSYYGPSETTPTTIIPFGNILVNTYPTLEDSGFLFAPSQITKQTPSFFYKRSTVLHGWHVTPPNIEEKSGNRHSFLDNDGETQEKDFMANVRTIKKNITLGHVRKIVLSRKTIISKENKKHSVGKIFYAMCKEYDIRTFNYIFYHPLVGIWIASTPEMFVEVDERYFVLEALAATKEYIRSHIQWTEKEYKEHDIVCDYITHYLKNNGWGKYKVTDKIEHRVGKISHLKKQFKAEHNNSFNWINFYKTFYPTPAFFGTPTETVRKLLPQLEQHSRLYYSGILGNINNPKDINLYVNLRCMRIGLNFFHLYTGAGITDDSDPLSEWEETELKLSMMNDIIQQL